MPPPPLTLPGSLRRPAATHAAPPLLAPLQAQPRAHPPAQPDPPPPPPPPPPPSPSSPVTGPAVEISVDMPPTLSQAHAAGQALAGALAPPQAQADWRRRHPIAAVSLNSMVRDILGQGVGRTVGLALSAWLATVIHHPDPDVRREWQWLATYLGGGMAIATSAVAGIYTGNMVSLTVHRRDPVAERRSPLWLVGLLGPVMTAAGLFLRSRFDGEPGAAEAATQALSRVFQYFGRDITGQSYTALMQYRRNSISPGFRLRILDREGAPLVPGSSAQHQFNRQRLHAATLAYALLCIPLFASALYLQPRIYNRPDEDHSFEGYFRGGSAWIIATVVLEALDAINGVVAHQYAAWRQGYSIELNEEETQVENLPEFVMNHALARTATNCLQDLAGALARGYQTIQPLAAWLALQLLPRTLAQILTEPRGFFANTAIDESRERRAQAMQAPPPEAPQRAQAGAVAAPPALAPPRAGPLPRTQTSSIVLTRLDGLDGKHGPRASRPAAPPWTPASSTVVDEALATPSSRSQSLAAASASPSPQRVRSVGGKHAR